MHVMVAATALAAALGAQAEEPSLLRMVALRPARGLEARFQEGYRAHLEWHRERDDPWAWLGWQVVSGERAGAFVDGSFGRRPEELDAPVDPAGDARDNALHVLPFASLEWVRHYRLLRELSTPGLDLPDAPFLRLVHFAPTAGDAAGAAELLLRSHRAAGARPHLWLELVDGGPHPSWLLVLPFASWSDAFAAEPPPATAAFPPGSLRSETLRLREELSYRPAAAGAR